MKITVVGAGWIGFPLAVRLKEEGHEVTASTTSEDKLLVFNTKGLFSILLKMDETASVLPEMLKHQDLVIISIPPFSRTKPPEVHISQIRKLTQFIPSSTKIIYTSSTSVYPEDSGSRVVKETDLITEKTTGHEAIYKAEQMILAHNPENLVVRLSGLAGYDRFLARHFAGKKNIPMGNWPVNQIHRDDVIEAINQLVLKEKSGIFNLCAPNHPQKREFYSKQCKKYNLALPEFEDGPGTGKVVSSAKLVEELNYRFKYPDPFDFQYSI